jgi:hypothetical protein
LYGVALPQGFDNNRVWFDSNKEDFAYCSSISVVVILYPGIWYLTSGIRALSLAGVVGKYFYFCRFFFSSEKKNEGRAIPEIFSTFLCKICRKRLYI